MRPPAGCCCVAIARSIRPSCRVFCIAVQQLVQLGYVYVRLQDVEYSVVDRGQYFYITLRDQARPNSELSAAPIASPSQQQVCWP